MENQSAALRQKIRRALGKRGLDLGSNGGLSEHLDQRGESTPHEGQRHEQATPAWWMEKLHQPPSVLNQALILRGRRGRRVSRDYKLKWGSL